MTLPNKWVNKTLRDLANVRVSNVDKKSYAAERPIRLCNYMDVYANDYLTSALDFMPATASLSEIERFALHAGDIIITKDSETPDDIGVPAVVVDDINGLVCGYHLALIRPKASVHPIYLAKQLASASTISYFAANATGSTRFGLAVGTIEKLEVPTPPPAEQAKIAEVLSMMDRAIEETEVLIAKQRRIKTGLMQDLLARGIDEHGNLRSEQTHEFKDSPIGRSPMPLDWTTSQLRDLANVRVSNVDKKSYAAERPIRLCNYMDVYANDYLTSALDFMPATASLSEIERFALHAGDIIITKDSETPDDIGVPAVVVDDINGLVCGYHLALIRPKASVHPIYLAKQLASASTISYFAANATGSTRFGLAVGTIEKLEVPTPPPAEQAKIAEVLSMMDRAIEETEVLIAKQRRIKTGLMQDLLARGIDEHGNLRSEQTTSSKTPPLGQTPVEWDIAIVN